MPEMDNILLYLYNIYILKSNSEHTNLLRIICFQIHSFLIRTAGKLNIFLLLFLLVLTAFATLYTEYIIQV